MERTVYTPDGRVLAVEDAGDLAGRPVLVHNGTPMSRHLYGSNVADAAGQGLRLIGYDWPGHAGSTPQPDRTVADCASDVRAICTALEISKWRCGVFPAAGRTCWPALRCCPIWSPPPPRSDRRRPFVPTG